jgi:hypothetical protein
VDDALGVGQALDAVNSAPEFYLVLGMRDFTHHITTVRDTYERVKNKGYHIIYREFEELGDRSYHPTSNDDAIAWAIRLRNKTIPPSPDEMKLLQAFNTATPPAPVSGYYRDLAWSAGLRPAKCSKGSSYRAMPASARPQRDMQLRCFW